LRVSSIVRLFVYLCVSNDFTIYEASPVNRVGGIEPCSACMLTLVSALLKAHKLFTSDSIVACVSRVVAGKRKGSKVRHALVDELRKIQRRLRVNFGSQVDGARPSSTVVFSPKGAAIA
jgi:hypothetical protein